MAFPVEYVTEEDTISDAATKIQTSASLRTSTAILLTLLLIATYLLNLILFVTILFDKKLRSRILYVFFCHLAALNFVTSTFTVLFSLIFVANGEWTMGMGACRLSAMMQQFCSLYTLFSLLIMAVERVAVLGETTKRPLFTGQRSFLFHAAVAGIGLAVTVPLLTNAIPVKQFGYRYLCSIGSGAPIVWTGSSILLFFGCMFVFLFCAGAILGKKTNKRNLPVNAEHNTAFISMTRTLHEDISLGKLVLVLLCLFVLMSGPYSFLCYYYQIRNSNEVLAGGPVEEMNNDVDTLITWLSFLFPLFAPILIFSWSPDIWPSVKALFCCRSTEPPYLGATLFYPPNAARPVLMNTTNVTTLVATPSGLQLQRATHPDHVVQQHLYQRQLPPGPSILSVPGASTQHFTEPPAQDPVWNLPREVIFEPAPQPHRFVAPRAERRMVHHPNFIASEEESDDAMPVPHPKRPNRQPTTNRSKGASTRSGIPAPPPPSLMKPAPKRKARVPKKKPVGRP